MPTTPLAKVTQDRAVEHGAAALVRPLDVGLDTQHPVGGLPVVADLAAEEAALQILAAPRDRAPPGYYPAS